MKHGTVNVLMVEDDNIDIMNVQRLFRQANLCHPLFIAENGRSALSLLQNKILKNIETISPLDSSSAAALLTDPPCCSPCPWVILLDMNLPQMNGLEFLQALSQDPHLATIPVVILISSPRDKERFQAQPKRSDIKVIGYMMKPISLDRLTEILTIVGHY